MRLQKNMFYFEITFLHVCCFNTVTKTKCVQIFPSFEEVHFRPEQQRKYCFTSTLNFHSQAQEDTLRGVVSNLVISVVADQFAGLGSLELSILSRIQDQSTMYVGSYFINITIIHSCFINIKIFIVILVTLQYLQLIY